MADTDWRVADPLSEVTRKERRLLLGISVLAFFVVEAEALPTKVSALGIDLTHSNQAVFLLLLSAIVAYLTIAFVIYAMSDFVAWRRAILLYDIESEKNSFLEAMQSHHDHYGEAIEKITAEIYRRNRTVLGMVRPVSFVRACLEFLFPIFIGGFVAVRTGLSGFGIA